MQRVAVVIGSCQEAGVLASDRAAIGLAIQRFGGPVDAFCLRDDDDARRYALAAGVASATRVDDIAAIDVDVVLVGSGGAEPWGDLLLALLAEQRSGAMVFDVLDLEPSPDGIIVTRDLGRGSKEVLALNGPAVLGIAEDAVQLLYVSRYRRQAVGAISPEPSPGSVVDPLSAFSGPWEPVRPRVKTGNLATRTRGAASARLQALLGIDAGTVRDDTRTHVIVADPATCAHHLLRFLRHHGVIAGPDIAPPAPVSPATALPRDRQKPGAPMQTPCGRGPRPLEGVVRGMERRPRPLRPEAQPLPQTRRDNPFRGPRPVGENASRHGRGPRPVDTKQG